MRTKLLAVIVSLVGWAAFAGCNAEAGYREEDATRDTAPSTDSTYADQAKAGQSADASNATADVGTYEQWDVDASGDVSKTEFDSKFASLPAWSTWDQNGDQNLDQTEVNNVEWFKDGSMSQWDADGDGKVARNEAADGLWKKWDSNGDNKIEQGEWPAAVNA